jgi:hypothetical protein
MAQTMRVSLPGYNALTEANIYRYSIYADSDNILIKELARGTETVANTTTESVAHNLNYIPFYLVYGLIAAGRYRIVNSYNLFSDWRAYSDDDNLYIENQQSAVYTTAKYFICYDNFT